MSPWDRKNKHDKDEKQKEARRKAAQLTSVLFVEQTPGGVYVAITVFRVKVVQKSGTTLKSILVRSEQWSDRKCGRSRCLPLGWIRFSKSYFQYSSNRFSHYYI